MDIVFLFAIVLIPMRHESLVEAVVLFYLFLGSDLCLNQNRTVHSNRQIKKQAIPARNDLLFCNGTAVNHIAFNILKSS